MLRIILLLSFVIFIFTIMTHELVKVRAYTSMLFFVVVTVAIVVLLLDNAKLDNAAYGQSLLFPSAHNSGLSSYLSAVNYQQQPSMATQQSRSNVP